MTTIPQVIPSALAGGGLKPVGEGQEAVWQIGEGRVMNYEEAKQLAEECVRVCDGAWHPHRHWFRDEYGNFNVGTMTFWAQVRQELERVLAEAEAKVASAKRTLVKVNMMLNRELAADAVQEKMMEERQ